MKQSSFVQMSEITSLEGVGKGAAPVSLDVHRDASSKGRKSIQNTAVWLRGLSHDGLISLLLLLT